MYLNPSPRLDLRRQHERQQGHRACAFDRRRDTPLVFGRNARDAARHYLSAFRNELPQKIDVLPIHIIRHDLTRPAALDSVAGPYRQTSSSPTPAQGSLSSIIQFVFSHNSSLLGLPPPRAGSADSSVCAEFRTLVCTFLTLQTHFVRLLAVFVDADRDVAHDHVVDAHTAFEFQRSPGPIRRSRKAHNALRSFS